MPPGSSGSGFVVDVVDDADPEEEETFLVTLSNQDSIVAFDRQATGTIQDNNNDGSGMPCILLSETSVSVSGPASTPTRRGFADQPRPHDAELRERHHRDRSSRHERDRAQHHMAADERVLRGPYRLDV